MSTRRLIVFTDLDGTLLDHTSYDWRPAKPAMEQLDKRGYPLIFASSKTFAEISKLRDQTGNTHPAIIENGGAIVIPPRYFADQSGENEIKPVIHTFAKPYAEIIKIAHALRAQNGYLFRGFGDMSVDDVCEITSLDRDGAIAAKARAATEPILWNENEERLDQFREQLAEYGLVLTHGGRFHHIMSPVDKGQAVAWLLHRFHENEPDVSWVSAALGDSENDVEMLEQVDYPVLIKNPYSDQPSLTGMSNLARPRRPGPEGWNEAVLGIIKRLDQGE
jgi:mannosyl-3-phosphoglycerate phosphatase